MRLATFLLTIAMLPWATPVSAEDPVNVTGTARRVALQAFARCTLEGERATAIHYALHYGTPQAEGEDFDDLASVECAEFAHTNFLSLRVSSLAFAGAVAEELIRGRDMAEVESAIPGAPALVHRDEPTMAGYRSGGGWSRTRYERELPGMRAEWMLDIIAECVVRRSPATVSAIFQTAPDSAEESSAVSNVVPHLAACVPAAQVRVGPDQLRLALAKSYLRLAVAAAPGFQESLL